VEPDLLVRAPHSERDGAWERAPRPILVVEILSEGAWRRDFEVKRALYRNEARISEYWIVDGAAREVTIIRPGEDDVHEAERVTWTPPGVSAALEIDLATVFQ
jgi:Uma2 family endonuclease